MKVKILYFSQIKDRLNKNEEIIDFDGKTLEDLINVLSQTYPNAKDILNKSMFAVNENYEDRNYLLKEGDIVAIIPPVSGG